MGWDNHQKGVPMDWETPRIARIDMNAEIGSYQPDFDDEPIRGVGPARAAPEHESALRTPASQAPAALVDE